MEWTNEGEWLCVCAGCGGFAGEVAVLGGGTRSVFSVTFQEKCARRVQEFREKEECKLRDVCSKDFGTKT